jgi:hypothetical protein
MAEKAKDQIVVYIITPLTAPGSSGEKLTELRSCRRYADTFFGRFQPEGQTVALSADQMA